MRTGDRLESIPSSASARLHPFYFLDPYTREHCKRVATYSVTIGEEMGLGTEALDRLKTAGTWHDIGKIGIDPRVLEKPGKLTDGEFALIKQHPTNGANIVWEFGQFADVLSGIELHHERLDGSGYPYGLAGDRIPLVARIIAVADTFDAITTNRSYQTARSVGFAVERIRSLAVSKLDSRVVASMEKAISYGKMLFTKVSDRKMLAN